MKFGVRLYFSEDCYIFGIWPVKRSFKSAVLSNQVFSGNNSNPWFWSERLPQWCHKSLLSVGLKHRNDQNDTALLSGPVFYTELPRNIDILVIFRDFLTRAKVIFGQRCFLRCFRGQKKVSKSATFRQISWKPVFLAILRVSMSWRPI